MATTREATEAAERIERAAAEATLADQTERELSPEEAYPVYPERPAEEAYTKRAIKRLKEAGLL